MRVMLIGEYSSFNTNLKDGLSELGHDVTVASDGDGFKNILTDIDLGSKLGGIFGKILRNYKKFQFLSQVQDYDVVQLINPFFINYRIPFLMSMYSRIAKKNNSFFLSAVGMDSFYWKYSGDYLKYSPFNDFLKYDLNRKSYFMQSRKALRFNKLILEKVDGIIPGLYEYEVCYKGKTQKLLELIPIPINVDKFQFKEIKIQEKLKIFHGLSRYGFTGTRHVEKAFEVIEAKYGKYVDLVIDGGVPFKTYIQMLDSADVVIDQVNSYSMGMNALISMAKGKVVMGGNEVGHFSSSGVPNPCINIRPNTNDIVEKIEWILDNPGMMSSLSIQGRKYIETRHDHRKVAAQYVRVWQETSKNQK